MQPIPSAAGKTSNMKAYFPYNLRILLLGFFSALTICALSQEKSPKGFIDFNGQYDSRNYANISLNSLLLFNSQFSYFGTMNHFSSPNQSDLTSYYHEHQVFYGPFKKIPLDFTANFSSLDGINNDALKLGLRARLPQQSGIAKTFQKMGLLAFANFYLLDLSQLKQAPFYNQMQYFYQWDLPIGANKDRLYIRGFANQYMNWTRGTRCSWVTEHQAGFRFAGNWYVSVEYRYNDFQAQASGIAGGLEYMIKL